MLKSLLVLAKQNPLHTLLLLPSFVEPLPLMAILAPVSRSIRFCVLPLGPIMRPGISL